MVAIQKFKYINGKTRTSIIKIIKFLRYELYLPLSSDAILCQWHYYIPNFKFLAPPSTPLPPRTITTTPPTNWNWEMLIISNYYKPPISDFNMKCQPLYYLPPPPLSAIRVLSIDSPDLNQNSDDITWTGLIYTWFIQGDLLVINLQKITRNKFTMYRSKALTLYQTGGGRVTFWSGACFDPKYLIFHKTHKAPTFCPLPVFWILLMSSKNK